MENTHDDKTILPTSDSDIVNRGTGAGGSNTNKNGLSYEKLTDLKSKYNIQSANRHANEIIFKNDPKNTLFFSTKQSDLFKYHTHLL